MFSLTCQIKIGDVVLNQVHDIKIEKSWRKLDDKLTIKFPRANRLLAKHFKVGDPVSVKLAYDGKYDGAHKGLEFEGYVNKIMPNIPLVIECEDALWLLRQVSINKSWGETTVRQIVQDIIEEANKANKGTGSTSITMNSNETEEKIVLSKYYLKNLSAADAINRIKQEFGLAAYFQGHSLYVGLAYGNAGMRVNYNVARNVIKSNLIFRREEDRKIKIKAISIQKDNKRLVTEVGDSAGDQRTFHFPNVVDAKSLKEMARAKLDKLKYDGFDGYITTFLIPYAEPGMTGIVNDPDQPEQKNGAYVIDSVVTTFGLGGARRKVELGVLLADIK